MQRSIGFIGVGNMGARMARRLVAAGHRVRVCERSDAARAPFDALDCNVITRAVDCAEDEITIVMVDDAAQVIDVVTGGDGLDKRLPTKNPRTIVVMGTVPPATCTQLQYQIGRHRARFIDAPVSGGLFGYFSLPSKICI
jgi:3-hydroxyisobutyrate dehydrogenase-like beta-hydroxyacid dehydrogenase